MLKKNNQTKEPTTKQNKTKKIKPRPLKTLEDTRYQYLEMLLKYNVNKSSLNTTHFKIPVM